jgi:hypothetical protein
VSKIGQNTYVAVGNAQDLSTIITNIVPADTPLLSSFGRTKATAVFHTWLEDAIGAPGENAVAEGAPYKISAGTTRRQFGNWTQIMQRGYGVTGTQEVVAKHGVRSELAYQMQKAAKEYAMDQEYAIINNGAATTPHGGTFTVEDGINKAHPGSPTAGAFGDGVRKFTGLIPWIANDIAGGGPFTEDLLNQAIEVAWSKGGNPKRCFMSPANKRAASTWARDAADNLSVKVPDTQNKITKVIKFYESDFGVIEMIPHRQFPDDTVILLDQQYIKMADLRPTQKVTPPKDSDNVAALLMGEHTMEVRATEAHAKITGLTVTRPSTRPSFTANTNLVTQDVQLLGRRDPANVAPGVMSAGAPVTTAFKTTTTATK